MGQGTLDVVVVGLGYFSQFHLSAWDRTEGARLVGLCDVDAERLTATAEERGLAAACDLSALLSDTPADIVDIVAPPNAHVDLLRQAFAPGRTIICQKPFCRSVDEAETLASEAEAAKTRIIIHENFRFQPWYRAARDFLNSGRMGQVYQARFALRPGDGRGPRAYLDRQPGFQTMPRLLLHETGVHFVDLFRWLLGDVEAVYADIRKLNPAIAGEDAGTMILTHSSGARSVFDGNRLADHAATNLRRTMGEMQIEGEGGTLALDGSGTLTFRPFGSVAAETVPVDVPVDADSFGGGCVAALIAHVVEALHAGEEPENTVREYLQVMRITEAAYRSARESRNIQIREAA